MVRENGTALFPQLISDLMTAVVVKYVFVILHIITAAAWFGLGLRLAGRAGTAVELGGDAGVALISDGRGTVWLMNIFIVLTFLFSLGAFIAGGHFAAYGPAYHSALTLIVILILDQFFVIRTGWQSLESAVAVDGSNGADATSVESARKRVAMGTGVGHLLWLVILGLMFWDQFAAVL